VSNAKQPENEAALLEIDGEQLGTRVERLSREECDALPFGVIRLDAAGRVAYLSKTEARLSGFGDRNAIGRAFFTELAPCMGTPDFRRRIEHANALGTLDIRFEQVGDFDDVERELRVRVKSASGGGLWVFIERPN